MRPRTLSTAQRALVLLGLLMAVRLVGLAWLPLMDTTEARYAEIGRRMAELGDWITPRHENGAAFWAKPPLPFWLTAFSFKLLGVNEFAARLPHFLCAALVAWLTWRLAAHRSRRQALAALALLGGSTLFYVSSGAVMTDGALLLGITLTLYGFWVGLHGPQTSRQPARWLLFVGLAVGLLAKNL